MATELGRVAHLLATVTDSETPLRLPAARHVFQLQPLTVGTAALVLLVGLLPFAFIELGKPGGCRGVVLLQRPRRPR
jgi:hypothetical protein